MNQEEKAAKRKSKKGSKGNTIALLVSETKRTGSYSESIKALEVSHKKISIEELRPIWNDERYTYNDKELYTIRDWLYAVAEVILGSRRQTKLLAPQLAYNNTDLTHPSYEAEESHSLRPGINRRTSRKRA